MSFEDLPPQPPINALADVYTAKALELTRATQAATRFIGDVCYGPDYRQRLDVYLPDDSALSGLPVLLFVYGGGWRHGYKEWLGFMAPPLLPLPANFVSVSLRLAPNVRYPEPLNDYFGAIKWAYRNIAKLGGDPERIFIGGHSSGAHLSALAALRTDIAERNGLPRNVVKACFPVSGIYDLAYDSSTLQAHTRSSIAALLGPHNRPSEASPITYVSGNTTPFYVVWSSGDNEIMAATSPIFVEALRQQPGRVEYCVIPNLYHFDMSLAQQNSNSPWVLTVREWMNLRTQT
jgi:arylformamidase